MSVVIWPRLISFSRHCAISFTNAGRYGKGCFAVLGFAYKIFNVGRLGFFVRAQPKFCFSRHRDVFIYSARKAFSHLGKKLYSPILIEKNARRHRPGKLTDGGLKKSHLVTPIEHFLIDIIQIFFRDWIDKTTAHIRRQTAATDIFQPALRNFFYKRRPKMFL